MALGPLAGASGGGYLDDLRYQSDILNELNKQNSMLSLNSNWTSPNSYNTGTGEMITPNVNYTSLRSGMNYPAEYHPASSGFGGAYGPGGSGGSGGSGSGSSGYNANSMFNGRSLGDVFANITGGGSQNFSQNQASGFNPYQYTPTVQNLQRPDRAVLPLSDEEEYLRQLYMGELMGPRPGEDASLQELLNTVGGMYLHPDSNPYLAEQINATGADTTQQFNKNINDILDRAGVSGALGGSRAALMQGQAAGESTRGFNQIVSDLLNQNYQTERGRQLAAIPGLLQTEDLPAQRYGKAFEAAGIPRGLDQKELEFRLNELLRQQNERMLPIQVGQSVLGQRMGQTIPIANSNGSPLSGLGSLLSGVGSAASGLSGLFGGSKSGTPGGGGIFSSLGSFFGNGLGGLFGSSSAATGGSVAADIMPELATSLFA